METHKRRDLSSTVISLLRRDLLAESIEEWQRQKKTCTIRTIGISMLPTLREGDILRVLFEQQTMPREGDIIIIDTGSTLLVHRVMALRGDAETAQCCEMGDNGWNPNWHPLSQVVGTVIEVQRGNKIRMLTSDQWQSIGRRILAVQHFFLTFRARLPKFRGRDRLFHMTRRLVLIVLITMHRWEKPSSPRVRHNQDVSGTDQSSSD